jgi:mRNA-degrading endonuclease RelE of RelBE toxin-antitoxin system
LWRYRIGDYRILCEIRDDRLIVLALAVGHRREIDARRTEYPVKPTVRDGGREG